MTTQNMTTQTQHQGNAPIADTRVRWLVQTWDDDCESWETCYDVPPCRDKFEAEHEARRYRSRCAYRIKTRVVKE